MQDTSFETKVLPVVRGARDPIALARAGDVPVRVVIENISANVIFLAKSTQDVQAPTGVTSQSYRLFPGAERVYVLAPGQAIYGAATGNGVLASISVSEAYPRDQQL